MATRRFHRFTLILKGVGEITDDLENDVLNAGCDDALLWSRDGEVGLDFERQRTTAGRAVGSAVDALNSVGYEVAVARFEDPAHAG